MRLTMVGTGYVGLVSGACFADSGNDVCCLDVDERKIAVLRGGSSPIYEPGLTEMLERNVRSGRLTFTTDKSQAYRNTDVVFICVGTPPGDDGRPDLTSMFCAADDVADALDRRNADDPPCVVVIKSTVPVGTCYAVRDRIAARTKTPFHIANNPEFLKEGAAISDFLKPDRVVCGVDDASVGETLRTLHDPFVRQGNPIFVINVLSSEMVKYASNAMLACKISFINEIANLCEHVGADIRLVRDGMCADRRIGNQFLYPGLGYGGSCFPKDTLAVVAMGEENGCPCRINAAVHDVNQDQRTRFWQKIVGCLGTNLKGKTLAFWGVAFKPQTDDIREAPAISLMQSAVAAGADVRAYDAAAAENLAVEIPEVTIVNGMYDALDDADALVICTEWSEFRQPDFDEVARRLKSKLIFDGRNIYRRKQMQDLGFTYYSVGRPPVNDRRLDEVPTTSD